MLVPEIYQFKLTLLVDVILSMTIMLIVECFNIKLWLILCVLHVYIGICISYVTLGTNDVPYVTLVTNDGPYVTLVTTDGLCFSLINLFDILLDWTSPYN